MSKDPITRGAFVVAGLAALGAAGWMTMEGLQPIPGLPHDAGADAALVDAGPPDTGAPAPVTSAAPADEPDAGLALSLAFDASALLNGPRKIHVGIVLVTFAGADGAGPNARPKPAALALAKGLAEEAKADFKHAVKGGDPGSDADFGHLERGVLASEPGAEAAVFGLEPGAVSDAIETSRGYWIVKRID